MTVVKSVSAALRDSESETQLNLNRPLRISPGPTGISAGPWPPEPPPITGLSGSLFLPPNGSSKMFDWVLSRIFDVKTRGDARTLQ
jgi:hypothetical protein